MTQANPAAKRRGSCSVVEAFCKAAPQSENDPGPITQCRRCGNDVCTNCSARVSFGGRATYGRIKRWCFNCIEMERGEEAVQKQLDKLAKGKK